jgi:hypothetical protein
MAAPAVFSTTIHVFVLFVLMPAGIGFVGFDAHREDLAVLCSVLNLANLLLAGGVLVLQPVSCRC